MLLFGAMSLTFPFSNRITGPINDDLTSTTADVGSGSGINSSGLTTSIISDELDYCGNNVSEGIAVNEDSIRRVPAKVWITLIIIVGIWITSRFVNRDQSLLKFHEPELV